MTNKTFCFMLAIITLNIKMTLNTYHQSYALISDTEIEKRSQTKEAELAIMFSRINPLLTKIPIKIAVLGCADARMVKRNQMMFERLFKHEVEIFTLDIKIEHLKGEQNIIEHDCLLPIPNGPYDVCYSHVLLKFIVPEKQFDVILNSYQVLTDGGMAIHVLDGNDYEIMGENEKEGFYSVDLAFLENELLKNKLKFKFIHLPYGLGLIVKKLTLPM